MKYRTLVALFIVSMAAIGCAEPNSRAPLNDMRQAIEELHRRHIQAALDEDIEATLDTVTDDFTLMPPNDPGARGKEATRAWLYGTVGTFRITELEFPTSELIVDQAWAFKHYTYDMTLQHKAGGDSIREIGDGLYVYRREDDGSWKIAYDIRTSREPPP